MTAGAGRALRLIGSAKLSERSEPAVKRAGRQGSAHLPPPRDSEPSVPACDWLRAAKAAAPHLDLNFFSNGSSSVNHSGAVYSTGTCKNVQIDSSRYGEKCGCVNVYVYYISVCYIYTVLHTVKIVQLHAYYVSPK